MFFLLGPWLQLRRALFGSSPSEWLEKMPFPIGRGSSFKAQKGVSDLTACVFLSFWPLKKALKFKSVTWIVNKGIA